ncbi:hypothetical protein [[Ruminococcus] torques]|uniref:hypothetical protein n=1 Tax=[Ruminococcus] torques TaxID=33039 RepID=UPI0025A49B6B|nr:hypothetical protein [[Ruminococcus] torques]MDM8237205.1 hypothetical protein [[Ruminococcus] torques]
MDTKEEKVENKEHQLCSDLNQSSSKNRIRAIISYNIKGIIIVALIIAFMVYLFMDKDNKIRQIFAENFLIIILIIYIIFMFIVNFFKCKKVNKIVETVQKKGTINSLLINIFLVSLLTIFLTVQSNENAQRQIEIADRETAPSLRITSYKDNYEIVNEKGMASYVTFNVYEKYNFVYMGEAYEISLATFYQEQEGRLDLTEDCKCLIFEPETVVIDQDKAFEIFNNYLYEKTSEDIVVSDSKELEVSFYDYKNESYTFQYNQYEGKIRLINTRKSIAPSHNITVIIWNEDQLEEQIKYAIEYLI